MAQPPPPEANGGAPPVGGEDKEEDSKRNKKEVVASKFFAGSPTPVSYIFLRRSPSPFLLVFSVSFLFFGGPAVGTLFEGLRNFLTSSPPPPNPTSLPTVLSQTIHTVGRRFHRGVKILRHQGSVAVGSGSNAQTVNVRRRQRGRVQEEEGRRPPPSTRSCVGGCDSAGGVSYGGEEEERAQRTRGRG